jgi:hypothetical protein
MKPNIRHIGLPKGDELESFQPDDPSNVYTTVRAMIGPEGELGEESFDISVCTPDWIGRECERKGHFLIRRLLVVSHWNVELVRGAIGNIISSVTGDSWPEIATKLATIAFWEFEHYREAP